MGSCFQPQSKTAAVVLQTLDRRLLEVRHEAALERATIIDEILEARGYAKIRIGDIPFAAIALEREAARRVIEAGGETIRLQQHAPRHLRGPSFHGLAENSVWNVAGRQVRGNRKPVGAGADDDDLTKFSHVLLRAAAVGAIGAQFHNPGWVCAVGRFRIIPNSPFLLKRLRSG